jgi:hypothetical protein
LLIGVLLDFVAQVAILLRFCRRTMASTNPDQMGQVPEIFNAASAFLATPR